MQRDEATPYWNNGIYCIRLNKEPSDRETQEIAVGIDPGSKKEGFKEAEFPIQICESSVIYILRRYCITTLIILEDRLSPPD